MVVQEVQGNQESTFIRLENRGGRGVHVHSTRSSSLRLRHLINILKVIIQEDTITSPLKIK